MNSDEKGWMVELTGCETIASRRIERVGNAEVKVYGTAHIYFSLAADIRLKRIQGQWTFGGGRITRATIPRYDGSYTPANVYRVKRIYCSDTASISGMAGRSIGGMLVDEKTLKLAWPVPKGFREPAVIFVMDMQGREEEAAFVSDHFLDYASAYELQLRNGAQTFEHGFKGALDKAHTAYQFMLRALP